MMNILLFVHLVVALLLIVVILLQRTGADSLSGIGGSNMGIVTGRSAANFLTKTTVALAVIFFINAIILANLSSQSSGGIVKKIEEVQPEETTTLPMAK
jgi:preprotein translocase subunit SecG